MVSRPGLRLQPLSQAAGRPDFELCHCASATASCRCSTLKPSKRLHKLRTGGEPEKKSPPFKKQKGRVVRHTVVRTVQQAAELERAGGG